MTDYESLVGKEKASKLEQIENKKQSERTQEDLELFIEAVSTCISKIDDAISTVEESRSELEQRVDESKEPSENEDITKFDDKLNQLRSARTTLVNQQEELEMQLLRMETFPEDSPDS